MNYPKRALFGLTWVGWLNTLVLQWLFVRLQGVLDEREDGTTSDYWTLIFPVAPLTGWWSDYVPGSRFEIWLGAKPPMEKAS